MYEVIRSDVFAEWLDDLRDRQARARIIKRIEKVENEGHFGDVSPVGDGVCEFRYDFGPGYRIYYITEGSAVVILLCGGDKSSQQRDIADAKQIAADWKDQNS